MSVTWHMTRDPLVWINFSIMSMIIFNIVVPEERSVRSSTEESGAWCSMITLEGLVPSRVPQYGSEWKSREWELHFVEAVLSASATRGVEDYHSPLAYPATSFLLLVDRFQRWVFSWFLIAWSFVVICITHSQSQRWGSYFMINIQLLTIGH